MIPDAVIDEIRERADIVAVIGEHIQLRKAGKSYTGLCPFHGEKTASFNVVPDKRFFHCFGCRKHGDVFTFLMEIQGKSFVEAAEQLAARCGIEIPKQEDSPELRRARGERTAMLDLNKVATAFFREVLAHPQKGAPGRAYLDKRGVDTATAERFQLGYAPGDWRMLGDHLRATRCDLDLAVKLGLVAPQPRAGGHYDRYRERLVCPVMVPGGDIVGFSARVVDGVPGIAAPVDRDPPPKYFNSPESLVYKKSKELYGLAQARETMGAKKRAVVVEGNFDVVSMHQAGLTEVVAPLGTALTPEQIDKLRRMTESVVLLYDGDRAGYAATLHALELCTTAEVEVRVVQLPQGMDPDSLVRTAGGGEKAQELLDRARDGFEFFATEVWSRARGNAAAIGRALDDAMRIVAKVANPTHRELVLGKLVVALDVPRAVVDAALHRAGRGGVNVRRPGAPEPGSNRPQDPQVHTPPQTEELEVLGVLVDHPDLVSTSEADKAFSLLTDARLRDICSAARAGQSLVDLITSPTSGLPAASATLVLSGKYAAETDPRARLAAMADNLHHRKVTGGPGRMGSTMADLQARMHEASQKGDQELARQLASEIVATRTKKKVD